MFEKGRDIKAAIKEFLQILGFNDKSEEDYLIEIFIDEFEKQYKKIKTMYSFYEQLYQKLPYQIRFQRYARIISKFSTKSDVTIEFELQTLRELKLAYNILEGYKINNPNEENAFKLGRSLGMFFGVIEYGITSNLCRAYIEAHKEFSPNRLKNAILAEVNHILAMLKEINKSANHKFIINRITKIAQEHDDELNNFQKELIAEIVTLFS